MKKLYALALGALVLATGCSKDDPEPVLPGLNVTEVTLTPTYTTLNVPAQTSCTLDDYYNYVVTFANGQEIKFEPSSTAAGVVHVNTIKGTEVVIPTTITYTDEVEKETTTLTVGGFDIAAYEGVSDDVVSIAIPAAVNNSMQGNSTDGLKLRPMNNEFFTNLSHSAKNLRAVYLEEGFATYISDKGVIYSKTTTGTGDNAKDVTTLVMVPRAYNTADKAFTVPNGVQAIGSKAFSDCEQFERIIVGPDVTEIAEEAFSNNKNIIAIDMLPTIAPVAYESSFGHFARKATLRIPVGSRASYLLSNPFEEIEPNSVHPVPPTLYITGMGFDRNKYTASNTADWSDEKWAEEVPAPSVPDEDATSQDLIRYQNARAGYAYYEAAMAEYEKNRANWFKSAEEWNADNQSEMINRAEPIYPGKGIVAPTRPTNPGAAASEEELAAYNAAMDKFYDDTVLYQADQGAIAEFKTDLAVWENAKKLWESSRGYKFFEKIEEVTFIY